MRGLLYREFVQNKVTLLIMAGTGLFLCSPLFMMATSADENSGSESVAELLSVFIFICVYWVVGTMQENLFTPDENRLWHSFVMAAPGGVKEILWVKYEFLMIVFGITTAVCYYVDLLVFSIAGVPSVSPAIHAVGFFWLLFVAAFDIPFIIRFGSKKGGIVKGICMLTVLLGAVIYALFGDISMFGSMDALYEFILGLLKGNFPEWLHVCMAVVPFLICGLYYLSYRISCTLYRKGADAYAD